MAHDGFLRSFHGLPWPPAVVNGATPPSFDVALQMQHALTGWNQDDAGSLAYNSALSSLVSSPSSMAAAAAAEAAASSSPHGAAAVLMMDELVSRLGVCGGLAIPSPSPPSCYSTPLVSPSKPATPLPAGTGKKKQLSRAASSQSLLGNGEYRKRKAPGAKAKGAITTKSPEPETRAKKCKLSTAAETSTREAEEVPIIVPVAAGSGEHGGNGKGKEKEAAEDPHKDYIHVRARRGQATDSHSLAERVRREKISERMKLLQDLVPSCNKVTGKAVMLDEIINYVQSLQRQVEFLSMKLSTVNPQMEFDVDNFLPKDDNEPCSLPATAYTAAEGANPAAFCYPSPEAGGKATMQQSAVAISSKGFEVPSSLFVTHGTIPASSSHQELVQNACNLWEEDDLQSVVQMGFRGNAT